MLSSITADIEIRDKDDGKLYITEYRGIKNGLGTCQGRILGVGGEHDIFLNSMP
jgi:predicted secreted protein